MPSPGTVNNPSGTNSFDHFAAEPAYGEATKDKALQDAAPLASGKVTVGALNAPKAAQRKAVKGPQEPRAQFSLTPAAPLVPQVAQAADPRAVWQQIAATPGAESYPLIGYYAGKT